MRSVVGGVLMALMIMTADANAAFDEDVHSAHRMLPYCKLTSKQTMANAQNALMYGQCFGVISGIVLMTELLRQASSVGKANLDPALCVEIPGNTTILELVDAVVKYGEAHPDLKNDRFEVLAFSAFRDSWPCRK